jgi:hypothetical protein
MAEPSRSARIDIQNNMTDGLSKPSIENCHA